MLISIIKKNLPVIIGGTIAVVLLLLPAAKPFACGPLGLLL